MALAWTPRYLNEEADALTNAHWEGFDPSLRIHTELHSLPWLHLPRLTNEGFRFFAAMKAAKAEEKLAPPSFVERQRKRPKGDPSRLTWREPW